MFCGSKIFLSLLTNVVDYQVLLYNEMSDCSMLPLSISYLNDLYIDGIEVIQVNLVHILYAAKKLIYRILFEIILLKISKVSIERHH